MSYPEDQLRADHGGRWDIEWRDYLDGRQLAASLRGEPDFIPIARATPAALHDALAEYEARIPA